MKTVDYIWKNGSMIAWSEATTHLLTHALHYGSAVFEGIRFYKLKEGSAVFKLVEHIERFFYSAEQLGMQIPYSKTAIAQAVIDTVLRNGFEEGYIRPLAYYGCSGYNSLKVVPTTTLPVEMMIACWPWQNYLPVKQLDVATSAYIRIHPRSTVADAKISGHYINSILAGLAIRNTHYHEALLLDANGYVAEGAAENIFIVKDGKIITPPVGTILVGITRHTVLQMAEELGLPVEERCFKPEEIYEADEAFFCGTAVEVIAIRSLDDRLIADGTIGDITKKMITRYHQITHGEAPQYRQALTEIPKLQAASGEGEAMA